MENASHTDLNTRVDLNEVVAVLLVDEELRSRCVPYHGSVHAVERDACCSPAFPLTQSHGLGQLDGVVQHSIAHFARQVLGRRNLNHLLVPALHRAITLVQVDNVAVVITEELNLDVLGAVKETLDEDGAVTEGTLGLRGGTLKGLLEARLIAHDTHATTTTTIGSLDNDWEAIFVGKLLNLPEGLNGTRSSGDDGDLGSNSNLPGRDFVSEGIDDVGGRPNELIETW